MVMDLKSIASRHARAGARDDGRGRLPGRHGVGRRRGRDAELAPDAAAEHARAEPELGRLGQLRRPAPAAQDRRGQLRQGRVDRPGGQRARAPTPTRRSGSASTGCSTNRRADRHRAGAAATASPSTRPGGRHTRARRCRSAWPSSRATSIRGEVKYVGNDKFELTLTNLTTGQSFHTTQAAPGAARSTAEWIVEAPYNGGVLPLANFGTVTFKNARATINGQAGPILRDGGCSASSRTCSSPRASRCRACSIRRRPDLPGHEPRQRLLQGDLDRPLGRRRAPRGSGAGPGRWRPGPALLFSVQASRRRRPARA